VSDVPGSGPAAWPASRGVAAGVLGVGAAITAAKLAFARGTPLFPDEAFYWQCAQRLALSYSDHPPLTAWMIRAGGALLGPGFLGVRIVFLAAAAAVPALVFATARPVVGARDAWLAAGATFVLPGLALLGVLAIPDVPLLFATALGVLAFTRALDEGRAAWWALAGVAAALGALAEYRFFPFGLAVAGVLLGTAAGRRAWRGPGPWAMAAIAVAGLAPTLLFNVEHDFAPLRYQLVERHDGAGPGPLKHLEQQLVVTTPLLYAALIATLGALVARARRGDARAGRFAWLAGVPIVFWLLASLFNDDRHSDAHWPLPAYLALLPFLPGVLRGFAARGRAARALALAAPGLGAVAVATLLLLAFLPATSGSFLRPFLGWTELSEELVRRLEAWPGESPVLVFDNYVVAGQAEHGLRRAAPGLLDATSWYVLDHRLNRNHGRTLQYDLWGRGEPALRREAGREALVVMEVARSKRHEHDDWRRHVAGFVAPLRPAGRIATGPDERPRRFRFFRGRVAP
jgi:4-amino-4-deoxy-L-arabinose transferase-like glycosyltransferase